MELNRNKERLLSFARGAALCSFSFCLLVEIVCWLDGCHFASAVQSEPARSQAKRVSFWGLFADGQAVLRA